MKSFLNKRIFLVSITLLAGAGLILFGYLPIAWQKRIIHQTLQRQSLTAAQVQKSIEQSAILEKEIAEIMPLAQRFEEYVPQTRQFSVLWQQIADLMTRCDLQDQQVRPGTESEYDGFNAVSLDIQASGTLARIFEFIGSLERMERLVRIEEMELTNDNALSGQLTLSAKAKVFYRTSADFKAG